MGAARRMEVVEQLGRSGVGGVDLRSRRVCRLSLLEGYVSKLVCFKGVGC